MLVSFYATNICNKVPTKSCAQLDPSSTSGVSDHTVSVETGSYRRFTLKSGKGERYVFLSKEESGVR